MLFLCSCASGETKRKQEKRMFSLKMRLFVLLFVTSSLVSHSYGTLCDVCDIINKDKFAVGTKENPGKSCKDILAKGGTESKVYFVQPHACCVHKVYCDQTTDGGGWTLVYSYTFTNFKSFNNFSNGITPRPSWQAPGDVPVSTTPPLSETDYNAMDFNLWTEVGSEFMIKSNINNWIACTEGTGSLINWRPGSLNCRLINNYMGFCENIIPDTIQMWMGTWVGPNIYKDMPTPTLRAYYYLEAATRGNREWPTHDPCGIDLHYKMPWVTNPHGNIYVR